MLLKSIWSKLLPSEPLVFHIPGDMPAEPHDAGKKEFLTTRTEIVELFQYELRDSKEYSVCARNAHHVVPETIAGE